MRMYDIIEKKRDKKTLDSEEIKFFIDGYARGEIPDYQVSALLMAIYLNKMSDKETQHLTEAMLNSGDTVDLSGIKGRKVDKHSTGGVGDKTTLILGPMVAACGLPFSKMSGRGLGHTGGTLDKLDSISGFKTDLTHSEFLNIINKTNICICSQSGNIVPADKKIYALRDVTATVDSLSLIAASIMSKKLALKSDAIVIDVKVGSGAFMKNLDEAYALSEIMVNIGDSFNRDVVCLLTDMDQPLGKTVGNALEVKESIEILKNRGPEDLRELCIVLGIELLMLGKMASDSKEARKMLEDVLSNGKAYEKLLEMVKEQSGDIAQIEDVSKLPMAKHIIEVKTDKSGYVTSMAAEEIGKAALVLGAGRETKESKIDLAAGIVLNKKIGDFVNTEEALAHIHCNDIAKSEIAIEKIKEAYVISDKKNSNKKLIFARVDKKGREAY